MGSVYLLLLLPILLLLSTLPASAQTYRNISLGSSLSAGGGGSSAWLSPSGEFAAGFRPLNGTGLFLFAVWFDKITDKTVVWSANGNAPVRAGSRFDVSARGQLLLTDDQGGEVWQRNPVNGQAAYAAVLDSGNFVLVTSSGDYAWDSFDEPTDTILPGQGFNTNGVLSSRRSAANFSSGRFQLKLQDDGNLVLYPIAFRDQTYSALWATNTKDGARVVLPESGYIYLLRTNRTRFNLSSPSASPLTGDLRMRATLDYDGVFRQYVHPRTNSNGGSWPWSWTTVLSLPGNICMSNLLDTGSGVCGFNSYCSLDGDRPSCLCPSGYSLVDPKDSFSGCKPDFAPQSCDSAGVGNGSQPLFRMMQIFNADWPFSDYEHYQSVDGDFCSSSCLSDCQCGVAIYRSGQCWKKRLPLSNGRLDSSIGGTALIKVGIDYSTTLPPGSSRGKSGNNKGKLISWVLFGSSAGLNCVLLSAILLGFFCFSHKRYRKLSPKPDSSGAGLMHFTYKDLEQITGGFREVLGVGASGTVYKGTLSSSSNSKKFVAVKKLDKVPKEKDLEFRNEIKAISRVHHKNLVPLLGYCGEGPHRLLVYEYMSNGCLANYLFAAPKPSWTQRIHIAFGVARGLLYLHEECQTQIIHCDIKPPNVLLDDVFTPRISDFGVAKLLNANQTRTTTNIRGTKGYVAPEWFKTLPVTLKVDVFSFGVLLLEIICCRRSVEFGGDEEAPEILTDLACDCYREGRVSDLVQDDLEALNDGRSLERLLKVAIWCIQEDPSMRPSMRKVTQMLEGTSDVPPPPDPCSIISSLP